MLLVRPKGARALLVLAHGAGAGMRHEFMEDLAGRLAARQVATLRYEFDYMAQGSKRPDPEPKLLKAVADAIARGKAEGLPLVAGGKSMGGRMTSRLLAKAPDPSVRGVVFFGFPLHPPKKPATTRGDHLADVAQPMLFLQGTRDDLAELELIKGVTKKLGKKATLHIVEGADHAFAVLKRSGRTNDEARDELADQAAAFIAQVTET